MQGGEVSTSLRRYVLKPFSGLMNARANLSVSICAFANFFSQASRCRSLIMPVKMAATPWKLLHANSCCVWVARCKHDTYFSQFQERSQSAQVMAMWNFIGLVQRSSNPLDNRVEEVEHICHLLPVFISAQPIAFDELSTFDTAIVFVHDQRELAGYFFCFNISELQRLEEYVFGYFGVGVHWLVCQPHITTLPPAVQILPANQCCSQTFRKAIIAVTDECTFKKLVEAIEGSAVKVLAVICDPKSDSFSNVGGVFHRYFIVGREVKLFKFGDELVWGSKGVERQKEDVAERVM